MFEIELIKLFCHCFGKWLFDTEVDIRRKRDAKRFLKNGRVLLAKGCTAEADIQFGLVLRIYPDIVKLLSQSEQLQLIAELEGDGMGSNAVCLRHRIMRK